ncbi:MAG: HEAT repeat domain-containing protein [Planctomycetota bacterium]
MRLETGKLGVFLVLLLVAAGTGAADDGPVFFEKPDRITARRIADALELMKRPYVSDHTRAREILEEIGYWAVEPLIRKLVDGNAPEQRNAALVLGTILDTRALPHLKRVAEESAHLYTPSFSALMTGKFRRESCVADLRTLIRSGKKYHRKIASVLSVAKIRSRKCYDVLLDVIRLEKRTLVKGTAIFCLGFFRDQALVRGPEGRTVCAPIRNALRSREEGTRRAGMLALALLGHRALKEEYLRFARNEREHPDIRRIALVALGRFPDEDVTRLFLEILANPRVQESVQATTALLLTDRKDPAALKTLLRMSPREAKLRAAHTLALSNFEVKEAVDRIIGRLTDAHDQVRAAAAIALARLVTPELKVKAIARLTALLQGKAGPLDPDVRLNMVRARDILKKGEAPGSFVWLGNEEFAADLPKDVEEKILDLVNLEVERVLGLTNIVDAGFHQPSGDPFRIDDEHSDLRDLKEYLEVHPYFEPFDIPEPELAITPRERPVGEGK